MDKKTLHKISYGVYIISSTKDGKPNGQIANALFQVTSEPPTIAVSINKQNLTHEFIDASNIFSVSILSKDAPLSFIGTFGFKTGKNINKFQSITTKKGKTNAPIVIDYTIGYLEARVVNKIDVGTHTIYIGEVQDAAMLTNSQPMTYEYYHEVKGGYSPKTAPTYSSDMDKKKEEKTMIKYVCTVCGYVYDPEKGDPDSGIQPGTAFKDIPNDWVCPVCGAGKKAFEPQ